MRGCCCPLRGARSPPARGHPREGSSHGGQDAPLVGVVAVPCAGETGGCPIGHLDTPWLGQESRDWLAPGRRWHGTGGVTGRGLTADKGCDGMGGVTADRGCDRGRGRRKTGVAPDRG